MVKKKYLALSRLVAVGRTRSPLAAVERECGGILARTRIFPAVGPGFTQRSNPLAHKLFDQCVAVAPIACFIDDFTHKVLDNRTPVFFCGVVNNKKRQKNMLYLGMD